MRQETFTVISNRTLAPGTLEMVLEGDVSGISRPGQFVNLRLDGFFLRRPISVCDWTEGRLRLVYKVLGQGTAAMADYPAGKQLDLLVGLGNGFDLEKCPEHTLLVGGGVGTPPLLGLARRLAEQGKHPAAVLGFNTAGERILTEDFQSLGLRVTVCTADGSAGIPGLVTDGMAAVGDYNYVCACGPEAMLRAVWTLCGFGGQFSFEERMGCGFGACMGCSRKTVHGMKRICREGPVLEKEEIVW